MSGRAGGMEFDWGPVVRARFVARPNRFLVRCELPGRGTHDAFLPNPGRLWELLHPGVMLYLGDSRGRRGGPSPSRRTRYTVMAVQRDGRPVFLHTHLVNTVARVLIEQGRVRELAGAEVVRSEYPVGRSRFDFLLRQGRRRICLEVKSCTQFGNGVAMFPDAVTERGRRHLRELASLGERGFHAAVLFVIHTPQVHWFMPDYHTDLEFSRTLIRVRHTVPVYPVALRWRADLSLDAKVRRVPVPWAHLEREAQDRGSYVLLLRLDRSRRVRVGRLGTIPFRPGYYVYVGSAMRNLSARLARHSRRRKRLRWHIDYLREAACETIALPIRSSARQECAVARALAEALEAGTPRFGSSDCACPTHLFWHKDNPLHLPSFHRVLQQVRMRAPG